MPEITIYSSPTCAPCNQLKRFMKLKGLKYTEKPVEVPENAAEAYGYTGMNMVPVTVVSRENKRSVISGYNLSALASALA